MHLIVNQINQSKGKCTHTLLGHESLHYSHPEDGQSDNILCSTLGRERLCHEGQEKAYSPQRGDTPPSP